MLGRAAVIPPSDESNNGKPNRLSSDSLGDEDDFADEENSSNANATARGDAGNSKENSVLGKVGSETAVFLNKFCENGGRTYRLCPEKWTINDQGFGPDLTCCGGDCQSKTF